MFHAVEIKQILEFDEQWARDKWVRDHPKNRTSICGHCIHALKERRSNEFIEQGERYDMNLSRKNKIQ